MNGIQLWSLVLHSDGHREGLLRAAGQTWEDYGGERIKWTICTYGSDGELKYAPFVKVKIHTML